MRLEVRLQRDIARLHYYQPTQTHRAIARAIGLSAGTVRSMRARLPSGINDWERLKELDDDAWRQELGTANRSLAQRKEAPDWQWVHTEMQRPDATLEQLWREWRSVCPEGVGYTQFSSHYRKWTRKLHVVMRRIHRPGEKLFVDFAGRTVEVRDAAGGPSIKAQIFVAVLGYSNYTYVEAVPTQKTEDWLRCHINCFEFLGGVPAWVVSDNLKAAVWRRERDHLVINPAYREALRHYDTAPMPAGPRKPREKSKAEVGVQIAQRWTLFRLRDRVFFSMEELNLELRRLNGELNAHPFKRLAGCRQQRFDETDQAALKPLPQTAFEVCDWRYGVLVGHDHHIEHGRCFYSVPSALVGERVDLRITASVLEVFRSGRRAAMHALLTTPGTVSTVPEHRPLAHQRVLEGEPREIVLWAKHAGPETEKMIRHHLEDRRDPTNGIRAARRMRDLARLHGEERFEEVCRYALPLNIYSLRSVVSILQQNADKRVNTSNPPTRQRTVHDNLRGAEYFGDIA